MVDGKYYEGTFKGGQGPVKGLEIKRESEEKGVLGTDDGEGHKLKTVGGKAEGLFAGSPSDKAFDMHSKPYAGPENWQPKNEGVKNPHDIKG